jgi:hypothetical protein
MTLQATERRQQWIEYSIAGVVSVGIIVTVLCVANWMGKRSDAVVNSIQAGEIISAQFLSEDKTRVETTVLIRLSQTPCKTSHEQAIFADKPP